MLRADIINQIAKLFKNPVYLEVGVWQGGTFRSVSVPRKVAVDPKFDFDHVEKQKIEHDSEYHELTSNDYFAIHPSATNKFDIIFLDGLHTFEQTLTDLMHAIDRVKNNGIIIIDDVIPDSFPASMRSEGQCYQFRQNTGDSSTHWMGDVYKLVFFINAFMLNWNYFTVGETHGQVVMWRQARKEGELSSALASEICAKTYADAVLNKDIFKINPLADIIQAFERSNM